MNNKGTATKEEIWAEYGAGVDPKATQLAAKAIEVAAFEVWPDIVFIVSGFFVPRFTFEILRQRGMKIVLIATESPYQDSSQLDIAPLCDAVVLNDPTNIDKFKEVCPNTFYIPHAYRPHLHKPGPANPDMACDFGFVGSGYPSRVEFFDQVDWRDISVNLAGNWRILQEDSKLYKYVAHDIGECLPNETAVDLYRSSKVSANIYRKEAELDDSADGWAMGPREVELAATLTFFLRESRPESDEVLHMLPTFTDPADFTEKMHWYLDHEVEREEAALKAFHAIKDRTFANNAKQLLESLSF